MLTCIIYYKLQIKINLTLANNVNCHMVQIFTSEKEVDIWLIRKKDTDEKILIQKIVYQPFTYCNWSSCKTHSNWDRCHELQNIDTKRFPLHPKIVMLHQNINKPINILEQIVIFTKITLSRYLSFWQEPNVTLNWTQR